MEVYYKENKLLIRSMTAQLCIHYATILTKDYEYNNGILHTQQYLLLHGISLYNVIWLVDCLIERIFFH